MTQLDCITVAQRVVQRLQSHQHLDDEHRARLYADGKKENTLQAVTAEVMGQPDGEGRELTLSKVALDGWNRLLTDRDLIGQRGGLERARRRGRIDVSSLAEDGTLRHLIEIKAWSINDAVEPERYTRTMKYNHSISTSFEIDALKIIASSAGVSTTLCIHTYVFTFHCDGMAPAALRVALPAYKYRTQLHRQTRDTRGIGDSHDYRLRGIAMMTKHLSEQFGRDSRFAVETGYEAILDHLPVFGPHTPVGANLNGIPLSCDLNAATLVPAHP